MAPFSRVWLVGFGLAATLELGCLSSSSSDGPRPGSGRDASALEDASDTTTGGQVNEDGGSAFEAGTPHAGFSLVVGGVRAVSSAHVLITTTGQSPGGNGTLHSSGHTIAGGAVGGTQKKP